MFKATIAFAAQHPFRLVKGKNCIGSSDHKRQVSMKEDNDWRLFSTKVFRPATRSQQSMQMPRFQRIRIGLLGHQHTNSIDILDGQPLVKPAGANCSTAFGILTKNHRQANSMNMYFCPLASCKASPNRGIKIWIRLLVTQILRESQGPMLFIAEEMAPSIPVCQTCLTFVQRFLQEHHIDLSKDSVKNMQILASCLA